ncbi:MAG: acyl carrier protein [Lachnospiraceae bacterium]|nr:acyl carrier protein [Lachnospiraceae bacterium]
MEIEEKLKSIIREFDEDIDVDSLSRESDLKEDLGLSSVSLLYLAVALEEEFGVDFANGNFSSIKTVGDLIETIESCAK